MTIETYMMTTGPGSYMRMKNLMLDHVNSRRSVMFRNATNHVQRQLNDLCDRVGQDLKAEIDQMRARLARDYLAVLVGVDVASMGLGPSRVELMLRAEMMPVLAKVDHFFAPLFCDVHDEGEGGVGGDGDGAGEKEERSYGSVKTEPDETTQELPVAVKSEPK